MFCVHVASAGCQSERARARRTGASACAVCETNEHTNAMRRGGRTKGDSPLLTLPGDVISHVR